MHKPYLRHSARSCNYQLDLLHCSGARAGAGPREIFIGWALRRAQQSCASTQTRALSLGSSVQGYYEQGGSKCGNKLPSCFSSCQRVPTALTCWRYTLVRCFTWPVETFSTSTGVWLPCVHRMLVNLIDQSWRCPESSRTHLLFNTQTAAIYQGKGPRKACMRTSAEMVACLYC